MSFIQPHSEYHVRVRDQQCRENNVKLERSHKHAAGVITNFGEVGAEKGGCWGTSYRGKLF